MTYTPTEHQEIKIAEALHILENNNRLAFIGSAGVGKTFVLEELVKRLQGTRHTKKGVICSAPTHKALKVLKDKVQIKVTFQTIHSVLRYQKFTDNATGNTSFRPNIDEKYPPLQNISLLLIDEASMIPLEMLMYLERYAKNCTIIFVGDDKQINPVGEEESPVFWGKPKMFDTYEEASGYSYNSNPINNFIDGIYCPQYEKYYVGFEPYPVVELTEIVRQGPGNPIIPLSRNIKAIWEYTKRVTPEGKGFLYTVNEAKIIEELAQVNGTDDFKYLAWTNAEVDRINTLVRQRLYGANPAKIEPEETIVFDSPYGDYVTNQELKVEKLAIDNVLFKVPLEDKHNFVTRDVILKVYIINGYKSDDWGDGEETWKGIFVVHEDSEKTLKQVTYNMYDNCKKKLLNFTTRNNFLENFAQFKYNHAISVHKSQGSTYKNVILNVRNLNANPSAKEKQRLFYTGITRASDLLILYNV